MKTFGLILIAAGAALFITGAAHPDLMPSFVLAFQRWSAGLLGLYSTDVNKTMALVGALTALIGAVLRR